RVGYIDGSYVLNPPTSRMADSKLDLVVAGTESAVLMVESEAHELSEEVMLGAVVYGHEQMQVVINAINELVEVAGKPEWEWEPPKKDEDLLARVTELAEAPMREAYQSSVMQERTSKIREVDAATMGMIVEEPQAVGKHELHRPVVSNMLIRLQWRIA